MVAREKVGLVVNMPGENDYRKAKAWVADLPPYPQDGYISEREGMIVVNLGLHEDRWRNFDFSAFRSSNEQLLFRTIREDKWIAHKRRMVEPFLRLAEKYPWTLTME